MIRLGSAALELPAKINQNKPSKRRSKTASKKPKQNPKPKMKQENLKLICTLSFGTDIVSKEED